VNETGRQSHEAKLGAARVEAPAPHEVLSEHGFVDLLRRRALVLDAAMGTRLLARGLELEHDDPALWNLSRPEIVQDVHRRDLAAGADAIVTNTFGCNRVWLARFRRRDAVESTNRVAVALARGAAGPRRLVLGSVGPSTAPEPGAAAEQAAILAESGADALLFETFRADEIEPVLAEVIRGRPRPIPIIVSLCEWPDPPGRAAQRLVELGACAVGLNCQPGAEAAVAFAASMDPHLGWPLLVKPSSGPAPAKAMTPAALAAEIQRLLELNVRMIGGCCGTTEKHVAAAAAAITASMRRPSPARKGACS
jgi:methionine synthase I (cobalamin-dependent)